MGLVGFESAPRYSELLERLLGDQEFVPNGIILEQDDEELAFLKRELRWATQPIVVAAVAAQNSFVQILNPGGSSRIVTVARVIAVTTAARTLNYAITTTVRGATGSFAAIPIDTRWNDPITPGASLTARDGPLQTSQGTTAGGFAPDTQIGQGTTGAGAVATDLLLPVVTLAPGTGVVLSDPTVNEALTAYFVGRSRVARPEELAR